MYLKSQPPDAPTPDGHRSTARRTYNSLSHGILYHLRGSHTIQNVCAGCYFYTMKEGDNHAKTQEISKIAEWLLRYGQIRYLGKGRRNPYGVYPPAVEEYDNGHKKTPPALCYVSDRMVGLAVLTSYKAGTYKPRMETSQLLRMCSKDSIFISLGLSTVTAASGVEWKEAFVLPMEICQSCIKGYFRT